MIAGVAGIGLMSLLGGLFGGPSDAAKSASYEETQLLNEANLQLQQAEATPGLISQRNAEEQLFHPINGPFNPGGTFKPVA